jgi:hypothetical protein
VAYAHLGMTGVIISISVPEVAGVSHRALPMNSKAPGARRAAAPRALMTGRPEPPGTVFACVPAVLSGDPSTRRSDRCQAVSPSAPMAPRRSCRASWLFFLHRHRSSLLRSPEGEPTATAREAAFGLAGLAVGKVKGPRVYVGGLCNAFGKETFGDCFSGC